MSNEQRHRSVRTKRLTRRFLLSALSAGMLAGAGAAVGAATAPAAGAAVRPAAIARGTLLVCNTGVAGKRSFSVGRTHFTLAARGCKRLWLPAGAKSIVQSYDRSGRTTLKSIGASPARDIIRKSIPGRDAIVRVFSRRITRVTFMNVAKKKPATSSGQPPNNPPSSSGDPPSAGTGAIEVCKKAGDSFVTGSFSFTIVDSTGASTTVSVPTGQCSNDVPVAAGNVTVTEAPQFPYFVSSVAAIPASGLVSSSGSSATFAVAANLPTTAIFTDSTQLGYVKVCKALTSNGSPLVGSTFTFNVSDAAGNQTVSVVAQSVSAASCALDTTPLPLGSVAYVTENAQPNVALVGVSVSPASQDAGSTATTAAITVAPNVAAATFTNEPMGWVEVCKNAADATAAAQSYSFSVNGGPAFSVKAGACGPAIEVPVGTATVAESVPSGFMITNITTQGITDPSGSRLLSGALTNPATVSVPFGGVGNETLVTFTDATTAGEFKICKGQSGTDAGLAGDWAQFSYSWTVNGQKSTGNVAVQIPSSGVACSGLIGVPGILTMNADLSPVNVKVSETSVTTDAAGWHKVVDVSVESIAYAGNGTVVSQTPTPSTLPASITFSVGAGMNQLTFIDQRNSNPVG